MTNVDIQMERLNVVRSKIQEIKDEKVRLRAELDTHKKRLDEITSNCKEKFDVEIDDVDDLIKQLQEEAERKIADAEALLSPSDSEEE